MYIHPANNGTNLVDSNLLLRGAQATHPLYALTESFVANLRLQNEIVYACPQNCTEFWAVATRPVAANGFGFSTATAEIALAKIERLFPLLPDDPRIYAEWRRPVIEAGVSGKPTHDARLLAVAIVYGIDTLLTYNISDFTRFAALAPTVRILDPSAV